MLKSRQSVTAVVTFATILVAFLAYERTFGRFTDFEQISEELRFPMSDGDQAWKTESPRRELEIAAVRGFGPDCAELKAPLALENLDKRESKFISGRGLGLYVYAIDYEILKDNPNQIRLHPFSLVQITPSTGKGAEADEILTVRGDEAILEFDRPIERTKSVDGAKPVAGWVQGQVELTTNRRSSDPSQKIVLFTEKLHYNESKNLVWADDWIRLVERNAQITGIGMELELHPKIPSGQPKPKRKSEAKQVRLYRNVRFHLLVDDNDNFLGPGSAMAAASAEPREKKEPTPLTVTARGPFVFDMEADQATFEKSVQVIRDNPPNAAGEKPSPDQLECDKLVLQFRQKSADEAPPPGDAASPTGGVISADRNRRLQTATATGQQVILLSESQRLQAWGNYLFHNSDTRQAILRGQTEMMAIQDNTIIHARSLVINQGEGKSIREMVAEGPNGWLEVLEEGDNIKAVAKGAETKPQLKVHWQGRLTMTTRAGSKDQLVTIDKGVELEYDGGALTSNQLKVLLVPVEVWDPVAKKPRSKPEPVKLEAIGNVSTHSEDWVILTENLDVDILRKTEPAPASKAASENAKTDTGAAKTAPAVAANQPGANTPPSLQGAQPRSEPEPEKEKKQPLEVRAQQVKIIAERQGSRSKPISAWAQGEVIVTQAGTKGKDDSFEARGQTLQFERKTEGDLLKVGGGRQLAVIKSSDMELAGQNEVFINEIKNVVQVAGPGYLIRESQNDLTGKKTTTPQLLRVDWEKSMNFDGKIAEFVGNVKAQQGTAEIHCQNMDVTFDHRIRFRHAREDRQSRNKDKAQIETVVCDKDVLVRDSEIEDGVVVRNTVLGATVLHYNNFEHTTEAAGPDGFVMIVEPNKAKKDENGKMQPADPALPFVVTIVRFQGQMRGDDRTDTAKFYDTIHIVHTPVERTDVPVDEDNLPPDGLTIDAVDYAMTGQTKFPDGKRNRDFQAGGNVRVVAREYTGTCDRLSYDQQKDLLIFDSDGNNRATFFKQERVGAPPTRFSAKTIKHWKTENRTTTDGSSGFDSLQIGDSPKAAAPNPGPQPTRTATPGQPSPR